MALVKNVCASHRAALLGTVCAFVAMGLCIVGIIFPYWVNVDSEKESSDVASVNLGIWQACFWFRNGTYKCVYLDPLVISFAAKPDHCKRLTTMLTW